MLRDDGTSDGHGQWVQVSRLGNPLINEVVIPLGQKDYWNRADPADDSQFEHYYSTPEVSHLENILYGTPPQGHAGGALRRSRRRVAPTSTLILLTGVPGLNFTGTTQADLLRLNTAIKPGANGACPGGTASASAGSARRARRRPVRLPERPPARGRRDRHRPAGVRPGLRPVPERRVRPAEPDPNNLLGDGVDANDVSFSNTFPYVASPHQGYQVP